MRMRHACLAVMAVMFVGGCKSDNPKASPRVERENNQAIIVAGERFEIGTRVVLWDEPGGYNGYQEHCHFKPEQAMPDYPADPSGPKRYESRRLPEDEPLADAVREEGWTLENLRKRVDLFVIHYDACGTSRQCFKVLQDVRGLSVQFMLDVDGTIYQTVDCQERAWHAGWANDRSIGVEIAHIGAYPNMDRLNEWYELDEQGWPTLTIPLEPTGIRTPGFVGQAARRNVVEGTIHKRALMQYDYTPEQYEALTKLTAGLARAFPKIELQAPRNDDGDVLDRSFSDREAEAYHGLCGHWHLTGGKIDPGPAFDWDRVIAGAKSLNAR